MSDIEQSSELQSGAPARRDLYALASRLLASEVDGPLYARLVSPEVEEALSGSGLVLVDPDVRGLPEEEALRVLAAEYCRLFIGPTPVCPPYASTQKNEALLGGRSRAKLLAFMERYDLAVAEEDLRVASIDHLAVELGLMAHVHDALSEPGSTLGGVEPAVARAELLRDHLLPWAREYAAVLASEARLAPYPSLGTLVGALLDEDAALLSRTPAS